MKQVNYKIEKTAKGYALVPTNAKRNAEHIHFSTKIEAIQKILPLSKDKKITMEHTHDLISKILDLQDLPTVKNEGTGRDQIIEDLFNGKMKALLAFLKTGLRIEAGVDEATFFPCENCGNHGTIIGKDFYSKVDSKMDGFEKVETMLKEKVITVEDKSRLDLQILQSDMPLKREDDSDDLLSLLLGGSFMGENPFSGRNPFFGGFGIPGMSIRVMSIPFEDELHNKKEESTEESKKENASEA